MRDDGAKEALTERPVFAQQRKNVTTQNTFSRWEEEPRGGGGGGRKKSACFMLPNTSGTHTK